MQTFFQTQKAFHPYVETSSRILYEIGHECQVMEVGRVKTLDLDHIIGLYFQGFIWRANSIRFEGIDILGGI